MRRLKLWPSADFYATGIALIVLAASLASLTQTAPTVPATTPSTVAPPQTAAQKRQAAAQARQAAAAQARQNAMQKRQDAAQARQTASQNRAAARTQPKPQNAASTATPATKTAPATSSTAPANPFIPPGSAAQPRSTAAPGAGGAAVGIGTLAWATRVYSPAGCVHNGNSAMCTFTFVNQGNQANLIAGGTGELSGIQLVDDAHVPHRWSAAYFMDKYGAQQRRLIVQPGDTGTYVVTFADVDPRVPSAEFHLRTQIIGGIAFSTAASNPAPATSATAGSSSSGQAGPALTNATNGKK